MRTTRGFIFVVALLVALPLRILPAAAASRTMSPSDGEVCERIRTAGDSGATPRELLLAMLQEAKSHAEDVAAHLRNSEDGSELRSRELECVNGERDASGACLCAADWFGEACDVSILTEAVYLPRRDPRRPSRRAAAQAAHFFRGAAGLIADLDRLQHRTGSILSF